MVKLEPNALRGEKKTQPSSTSGPSLLYPSFKGINGPMPPFFLPAAFAAVLNGRAGAPQQTHVTAMPVAKKRKRVPSAPLNVVQSSEGSDIKGSPVLSSGSCLSDGTSSGSDTSVPETAPVQAWDPMHLLTGGTLELGGIADDKDLTPQERSRRRKIRNRVSAQLHRERQRSHVDSLESAVVRKDAQIQELEKEVSELKTANSALVERVKELEGEVTLFTAAGYTKEGVASGDVDDSASLISCLEDVDFLEEELDTSEGLFLSPMELEDGIVLSDDAPPSLPVGFDWEKYGSSGDNVNSDQRHAETVAVVSGDSSGCDSDFDDILAPLTSDRMELGLPLYDEGSQERSRRRIATPRGSSNTPAITAALGIMFIFSFFTSGRERLSGLIAGPGTFSSRKTGRVLEALPSTDLKQLPLVRKLDLGLGTALEDESSDGHSNSMDSGRWTFHPVETQPKIWRSTTARSGGAPWSFTQALDLYRRNKPLHAVPKYASTSSSTPPQPAASSANTMPSPARDVDIYRGGGTAGMGAVNDVSEDVAAIDKSYLYCPQAHGMMGPRIVAHAARSLMGVDQDMQSNIPSSSASERALVVRRATALAKGERIGADKEHVFEDSSTETNASSGFEVHPPLQYMSVLVPGNTFDWGHLTHHINALNTTHTKGGAETGGWLEVACQVLSVRAVTGVSFGS